MACPILRFKQEKTTKTKEEFLLRVGDDKTLTPAAKLYLIFLLLLPEYMEVPQRLMCELTGNSERTNDRARKSLVEKGYIRIEPRKLIEVNLDKFLKGE